MTSIARLAWMEAWEDSVSSHPPERRDGERVTARTDSTRYYGREATARVPQPSYETGASPRTLPELRVVTSRQTHWGLVVMAMVLMTVLLAACVIAPTLIHSAATGLESTIGQLESQQKELAAANSALSAQISALSSPERVAEVAGRLGLGPAVSVHYIQAEPGTVATEGDPTVAGP